MLEKAVSFVVHPPRLCFASALILALVFCGGLTRFGKEPVLKVGQFMDRPREDPDRRFFENVEANFAQPPQFTIVIESPDIFRRDCLKTLKGLTEHYRKQSRVSEVISLSTIEVPFRTANEITRKSLLSSLPETAEGYEKLRKRALQNPILTSTVLDEAGTAAAIHVFIARDARQGGMQKWLVPEIRAHLAAQSETLGPDISLSVTGNMVHDLEMDRTILRDLVVLTPISLLVVALILLLHFRTPLAVVVPVFIGLLTVASTFGFIGYTGIKLWSFRALVPPLLLIVGCVEDVHLLSEFARGIGRGLSRREAVKQMFRRVGRPVLFSLLTTLIGFAVLIWHPNSHVGQFAAVCVFGLALNLILTLTMLPAFFQLARVPRAFVERTEEPFQHLFGLIRRVVLGRHGWALAVFMVLTGIVILGTGRLEVGTRFSDMSHLFTTNRPESPEAASPFGGMISFPVVVETGEAKGIHKPENFEAVARFSEALGKEFYATYDFTKVVLHARGEFYGAKRSETPTRNEIADFLRILTPRERQRLLDYDGSRIMITVRHPVEDTRQMMEVKNRIDRLAKEILPGELNAVVTGKVVLFSKASALLGKHLAQDLAVVLAAIAILIAILLRSPFYGLLALLPNVIPVAAALGIMGWSGVLLSSSAYPFVIVILVIAVNDTIHFFSRYVAAADSESDPSEAVLATVSHELRPVVCTTISLCFGFLVMLFGSFAPLKQAGLMVAAGLLIALVCDLLLTPMLLVQFSVRKDRGASEQ